MTKREAMRINHQEATLLSLGFTMGASGLPWARLNHCAVSRKPTIYEVLRAKLQREPTHVELCAEVRRILAEGLIELATAGKLTHQRKGR